MDVVHSERVVQRGKNEHSERKKFPVFAQITCKKVKKQEKCFSEGSID